MRPHNRAWLVLIVLGWVALIAAAQMARSQHWLPDYPTWEDRR